jgi:hypothetical protein
MSSKFVKCVKNPNYPVSLEVGHLYRVVDVEQDEISVIDESGEAYYFSRDFFVDLEKVDLGLDNRDELLMHLRGKEIEVASLAIGLESLRLYFTDGTCLIIESHIPRYEHHAELDLSLECPKSE